MKPTTRFVLDPLRSCNLKCKFCYYLHTYDDWKNHTWSLEKVKVQIDAGKRRGNDYMDITGGEPTLYPHICEAIGYAMCKGILTCIITNGLASEQRTKEIIDAGVDEFLISRHGLKDTHDFVTNCQGAYERQERFIEQIKDNRKHFRFNCVINRFNQAEIFEIAIELARYKPNIVNFINMNPHHEWMEKGLETKEVAADLNVVVFRLNSAIRYLEQKGIGVNVRYYPMCRIAEEYRRCICNDLHVMFDPYEWDYGMVPKTNEAYSNWGERTSQRVECREQPCSGCKLQFICGGINKAFNTATGGKYPKPVNDYIEGCYQDDFYYYRKHNTKAFI